MQAQSLDHGVIPVVGEEVVEQGRGGVGGLGCGLPVSRSRSQSLGWSAQRAEAYVSGSWSRSQRRVGPAMPTAGGLASRSRLLRRAHGRQRAPWSSACRPRGWPASAGARGRRRGRRHASGPRGRSPPPQPRAARRRPAWRRPGRYSSPPGRSRPTPGAASGRGRRRIPRLWCRRPGHEQGLDGAGAEIQAEQHGGQGFRRGTSRGLLEQAVPGPLRAQEGGAAGHQGVRLDEVFSSPILLRRTFSRFE